jgi:signal transduction histidine kinase
MVTDMAEKANILLVDDKPERLLSYEVVLESLGQNLVCAHSGNDALQRLMENEYAAILLDVNMPDMNGFETAALIREHPRFENTPIIFVTGVHVTDLDQLKGYQMGAVDYVYIPVVPEILRGKVQVLVQLYLQRRELAALNSELTGANEELAEAHRALQAENLKEKECLNRNLEQANVALAEANDQLMAEIAERKKAEELLHEEARRKDEFIAILAHELRNPLAAIHAGVQVLGEPSAPRDQVEWVHAMLERQVKHLICLIDDLLDVSRVTHGRIQLQRKPVELAELVQYAVETVRPVASEQRLTLEMEVEPALYVDGDPVRLAQVLDNLLSNAVKHTAPGGAIQVRVQAEQAGVGDRSSAVCIQVKDTGIGIPADMLERVFDLFVQAESHANGKHPGLGIGLALVRGLVDLHGGTVHATSEGANQGTEFTVRLPLISTATSRSPVPAEPDAKLTETLRILIIDDNVDSSKGLAICLEGSGHEVCMAHDGDTGVCAACEFHPDVVLLDIGLPDVDGYQVAEQLRQHKELAAVPLIAITGFGAESDRLKARKAGFSGYLVKPVNYEALEAMLFEQLAAQVA